MVSQQSHLKDGKHDGEKSVTRGHLFVAYLAKGAPIA